MNNFLKKYQLILVLSFIAISLFFIKINYGYKNTEEISQIKITPTIVPTISVEKEEIKTEIVKESSESARIKLLLPYINKDFVIESFDGTKDFRVKILNTDKVVAAQGILKWFQKNKLNPIDYQVVFVD